MDLTHRMTQLLSAMRRERNGAVADAMGVWGRPCGLNYGVSLTTVRQLARAVGRDDAFSRYLWLQDVRELRLAALHIASPDALDLSSLAKWEVGIVNAELAEEFAFALLSHSAQLPTIVSLWMEGNNPWLHYTALLAAARCPCKEWLAPGIRLLSYRAVEEEADEVHEALISRGVTALLAALLPSEREAVVAAIASFGNTPCEVYVREEIAWRLEE